MGMSPEYVPVTESYVKVKAPTVSNSIVEDSTVLGGSTSALTGSATVSIDSMNTAISSVALIVFVLLLFSFILFFFPVFNARFQAASLPPWMLTTTRFLGLVALGLYNALPWMVWFRFSVRNFLVNIWVSPRTVCW